MLFEKKTRKTVKIIWMVLSVLIVISMLLFFAPGLIPSAPAY